MRLAGTESWRFATGLEQAPTLALFVRDAAELQVAQAPDVPPPLEEPVFGVRIALDESARAEAGCAWLDWWRAIVAFAVAGQRGVPSDADQRKWVRRWVGKLTAVVDPPEFASLGGHPALR